MNTGISIKRLGMAVLHIDLPGKLGIGRLNSFAKQDQETFLGWRVGRLSLSLLNTTWLWCVTQSFKYAT